MQTESESSPERSNLKLVTMKLEGSNIQKVILKVLKSANLPTSFVDSLAKEKPNSNLLRDDSVDGIDIMESRFGVGAAEHGSKHRMDVDHPLDEWLKANVQEARKRQTIAFYLVCVCHSL